MRNEIAFDSEQSRFLKDITDFRDNPLAIADFIKENHNNYFKNMPDGEYKIYLLNRIYSNDLCQDPENGHRMVQITSGEISFLQKLPTDKIKRIFYALLIRAKSHPHQSGWISLDFPNTLNYSFSKKEVKKFKIEEFSECVSFGLEMRVSGSTKPVLCFKIPKDEINTDIVFEFEDGVAMDKYGEIMAYEG